MGEERIVHELDINCKSHVGGACREMHHVDNFHARLRASHWPPSSTLTVRMRTACFPPCPLAREFEPFRRCLWLSLKMRKRDHVHTICPTGRTTPRRSLSGPELRKEPISDRYGGGREGGWGTWTRETSFYFNRSLPVTDFFYFVGNTLARQQNHVGVLRLGSWGWDGKLNALTHSS